MRTQPLPRAEAGRIRQGPYASEPGAQHGAFRIKLKPGGSVLLVIAGAGLGWDHVSASLKHRCPTWEEMCAVKDLFFEPEETVMQLHPPKDAHVNNHPFCLHLWRPQHVEIPMPPGLMVGVRDRGPLTPEEAHALGRAFGFWE
jgi:hypothetical protein